jgi:hypothetical protein
VRDAALVEVEEVKEESVPLGARYLPGGAGVGASCGARW